MSRTTDDYIQEVREQLDEFNEETVDDPAIIRALNRGQRKAANVISRKYEEMLSVSHDITTTSGTSTYALPTDILGERVIGVEVVENNVTIAVDFIDARHAAPYISSTETARPWYYSLRKKQITLYPSPKANITIRVHYVQKPLDLVKSQGRVFSYDATGGGSVVLDALGNDLTTAVEGLNAYVGFVNFATGEIKGYSQVESIDTTNKELTFKATPSRTSVLNKTVGTSLPSDISEDDYVCTIHGTAISILDDAYMDYVIQFAVLEIKRRFGEPSQEEVQGLREQFEELKKIQSGRENKARVRKTNSKWSSTVPRPLYRNY